MNATLPAARSSERASATSSSESNQYLTFMLDREVFAIGILAIKEIIEYGKVTVVPMMPPCIRGVINLRGAVVPVLDLLSRFGGRSSAINKRTCIVIVEIEGGGRRQDIGVLVDAVNEVIDIPSAEIEPAPAFGTRVQTEVIQGMGKVNGGFVIILRPERVLSVDDLAALSGSDVAAHA